MMTLIRAKDILHYAVLVAWVMQTRWTCQPLAE